MRMFYYFNKAIKNIIRNLSLNIFAIIIISSSLTIASMLIVVNKNIKNFLSQNRGGKVIVYLEPGVEQKDIKKHQKEILKILPSKEITYSSPKEAFDSFKKSLKEDQNLLNGIDPKIIPPYFTLKIDNFNKDFEQIVVPKLKKLYFVSYIDYGKEVFDKVKYLQKTISSIQWIVFIFIVISIMTTIYMTIRLTIYTRKDEIEILQLVGATNSFIKYPFYIEGGSIAVISSLFAIFLLYIPYTIFYDNINNFLKPFNVNAITFIPFLTTVKLILGVTLMGIIASHIAVKKFLNT